jgi:hypothetical protein
VDAVAFGLALARHGRALPAGAIAIERDTITLSPNSVQPETPDRGTLAAVLALARLCGLATVVATVRGRRVRIPLPDLGRYLDGELTRAEFEATWEATWPA